MIFQSWVEGKFCKNKAHFCVLIRLMYLAQIQVNEMFVTPTLVKMEVRAG